MAAKQAEEARAAAVAQALKGGHGIGANAQSSFTASQSGSVGQQRINNTVAALMNKVLVDAEHETPPRLLSMPEAQERAAQLAQKLANSPDGMQELARIGGGQLGFDPMHNLQNRGQVNFLLHGIHDELHQLSKITAAAPPATSSVNLENIEMDMQRRRELISNMR
jgi:hypothetical protein